MADAKISALTTDASPTSDDLIVTVNDPGGTPANRQVTIANLLKVVNSLTSVTPATEDVALLIDDPSGTPVAKKATLSAISNAIEHAVQSHGNTGATETIDVANGFYHAVTLDASCTFTFTSPASGTEFSFILEVTEDGTGGRTVTWPGSVVWPGGITPSHNTAASSTTVYVFVTRDGGTTWRGFQAGLPAGYEYDYVEFTSSVNITATAEASATTVVTANAITFDGATTVYVEFFCPRVAPRGTVAGDYVGLYLYDGESSIGQITLVQDPAASQMRAPANVLRKLTPSAASHTYSIRGIVNAGTGVAEAGAGGSGNVMPGFIRIRKA